MMPAINNLLGDKVKQIWTDEIQKIAREFHLANVIIVLDSVTQFHVYLPYIEGKNVCLGFDPEFTQVLKKNGFDVHLQYADKINGMALYGKVTKKL